MSGGHSHALYVHGHTAVHDTAPHVKLVALLLFVVAVVATPRTAVWAFALHALVVVAVVAAARIPARFVAARMLVEVPFLLFAVFLPFIGSEPRFEFAGLALSEEGTWAAWSIFAKGTLGVCASIVLAATTEVPEILAGLDRLRAPKAFVAIAGFMIRYLEVIAGEMRRMRLAMAARGYRPRAFWQARALATSAGALFIRSFERGERVYLAMVSRGYDGVMPVFERRPVAFSRWLWSLAPAVGAWAVAAGALVST